MNTGYLATAVELSFGKGKLASGVSRQTGGLSVDPVTVEC